MRPLIALAALLLTVLVQIAPARAQNALIPPGAQTLPENLRRHAVVPLVLTPGNDRTACLGAMIEGDSYDRSEITRCDTVWNQRVTLEAMDPSGNQMRIRFGSLGCLYSTGTTGLASIGICDDRRAAETWTVRDQQLVDHVGRCLQAASYPTSKVLRPQTLQCNSAAPAQQWFVDSMRAVQDRLGAQGRAIWGMDSGRKDGMLREVVEQLRPRFSVRPLSSAEKAEVRQLRGAWKKSPPLPLLEMYGTREYWKKREGLATVVIDWPVLRRLGELAESGDRDAMHAVLEGLVVLQYGNARGSYDAPGWRTEFPEQGNRELIQVVVPALRQIWGAHYWQRHGPDRLAALSGANCMTDCLGYSMRFVQVGKYANPFTWAQTGKSDYAFRFEDISFSPVNYTPQVAEQKFIAALNTLSWGQSPGADDTVFGALHAARTGRLALWDAVILSGQTERWAHQSVQGQAMLKVILARREDASWRQEFATFMSKPAPTGLELWTIQNSLVKRSDADIMAFAARYTVTDRDLIQRFCTAERAALPSCQRGRAELARFDADWAAQSARNLARAEAERAAAAAAQARFEEEQRRKYAAWRATQKPSFWDKLAGLAEGFDAAMRMGNTTVTVREYDSAGNYIGSREVNRATAIGQGATPAN